MLKTCEKNAFVFQETLQSRRDDHVLRMRLQSALPSITCLGLPEGEEFWEALFEQTTYYRNSTILSLIPQSVVARIRDELNHQGEGLDLLISTIKTSVEQELEDAPDLKGHFLFLNRTNREENRKAYFNVFDKKLTKELGSWLLTRGWKIEDVQCIAEAESVEELVEELTSYALDELDYCVIQSIPIKYAEIVLEELQSARNANLELLGG